MKFDLFPGSFQFPKDSCEGASRVFAHIAGLSFPQCKVELIEGYDFPNNERHYWVLVDNMVYDLTCDQFDGFTKPILGESGTPLSTKYCDLEVHSGDDIYQNWNPGGRYDKIAAVGFVEHFLKRT